MLCSDYFRLPTAPHKSHEVWPTATPFIYCLFLSAYLSAVFRSYCPFSRLRPIQHHTTIAEKIKAPKKAHQQSSIDSISSVIHARRYGFAFYKYAIYYNGFSE